MNRIGWRLAAMALIFGGLFGVLALRLWYLQVTTIADSLDEALGYGGRAQLNVITSLDAIDCA